MTNCTLLHLVDSTFRAGIATWVAERRCPVALGDFLEELGLVSQARVARAMTAAPDRRVYKPQTRLGERRGPCGPFPTLNDVGSTSSRYGWFWATLVGFYGRGRAAHVLAAIPGPDTTSPLFGDVVGALLWALDAGVEV